LGDNEDSILVCPLAYKQHLRNERPSIYNIFRKQHTHTVPEQRSLSLTQTHTHSYTQTHAGFRTHICVRTLPDDIQSFFPHKSPSLLKGRVEFQGELAADNLKERERGVVMTTK
jgi:hypothetical protein